MTVVDPPTEQFRADVERLCRQAFPESGVAVGPLVDVNRGRGAFSVVLRATLQWPDGSVAVSTDEQTLPSTVVAKLPIPGANGEAAASGGAYRREALAYRTLIPRSPVRTPALHAIRQDTEDTCLLLIEDLSPFRSADQLDGLNPADALLVAGTLRDLHRAWSEPDRLAGLAVRRNTINGLAPEALRAGLHALADRWGDHLGHDQREVFHRLVAARPGLVDRFERLPATLCHGDPRADNLVFDDNQPGVILFDWQQVAVQFGEADLAWMAATSLDVEARRGLDQDMVTAYGGKTDNYRLGLALPGLAVLMLAQRDFPTERAQRFVAVSLQRIAAALTDLDVPALG